MAPLTRRIFSLIVTLALASGFLAGCMNSRLKKSPGSSSNTSPDTTGADSTDSKEPPPLTKAQKDACEQFFHDVDQALAMHIAREGAERNELLARSFPKIGKPLQVHPSRLFVKSSSEEITSALASVPSASEFSTCAPYLKVARALKPADDLLVVILRAALATFANELDLFSKYTPPAPRNFWVDEEPHGAGIVFHQRTDYLIGRSKEQSPDYLVVKGAHAGAEVQLSRLPVNARIYAVYVNENKEWKKKSVKELGYAAAVEWVNFETSSLINGFKVPDPIRVEAQIGGGEMKEIDLPPLTYTPSNVWTDNLGTTDLMRIVIRSFDERAIEDFKGRLVEIYEGGTSRTQGILLDLRGNLGGMVKESGAIADSLLPYGSVVQYLKDKAGNVYPQKTGANMIRWGHPPALVILVDSLSASASEVFAAALQAHGRALLVGERTYGKGLAQAPVGGNLLLPAPLGGSFYVVAAHAFTPTGESYANVGIRPDVEPEGGDPVLQQALTARETPFTLQQLINSGETDRIIKGPESLSGITFRPAPSPMITNEVRATLRAWVPPEPDSCSRVPGDSAFEETDDCLLDWGKLYLRRLVEITTNPPRS